MSERARPRGTDDARIAEVIVTESLLGAGVQGDPVRNVIQFWGKDGELLAARDDWEERQPTAEQLLHSLHAELGDVEIEIRGGVQVNYPVRGDIGVRVSVVGEPVASAHVSLTTALESVLEQVRDRGL